MAALSTAAEAELETLKRSLQRSVNCLSDPDRATRKGALRKLQSQFFGRRRVEVGSEAKAAYFSCALQRPLVAAFCDEVEKIRELSLILVLSFLGWREEEDDEEDEREPALLTDLSSLARATLPALSQRIGSLPLAEPSEELRFLMLQLATLVVQSPSARDAVKRDLDALVQLLASSLTDNFPDSKKQCARCLVCLCASIPECAHLVMGPVLRPLLGNLAHQHSKVRQCSLNAIGCLASHGGDDLDKAMHERILPAFRRLGQDRAASVRRALVSLVVGWFGVEPGDHDLRLLPGLSEYEPELVEVLLCALSDAAPDVQRLARDGLEALGSKHTESDDCTAPPPVAAEMLKALLPEPFEERPGLGARRIVVRVFSRLLSPVLKDADDWTTPGRLRAMSLIRSMLVYVEFEVTAHLEDVLTTLCRVSLDEDDDVAATALECARLVGLYVDAADVVAVLLPRALGEAPGTDTSPHRAGALCALSAVVTGFDSADLAAQTPPITAALCDPALRESEALEVQTELAKAVECLLDSYDANASGLALGHDATCRLLVVLLQLRASAVSYGSEEACDQNAVTADSLKVLARLSGQQGGTVSELFRSHASGVLAAVLAGEGGVDRCAEWGKHTPARGLFDELVRSAGGEILGAAGQIPVVVSVLLTTLPPSRDPDLRLGMLALTETLLKQPAVCAALRPHLPSLIEEGILPNVVWRVGRVAATIRKVGVFCLRVLFSAGDVALDFAWLRDALPRLTPILKGSLDDFEADTRRFACGVFGCIFRALREHKAGTPTLIHELYPDLIKRLDDSNDAVRAEVCTALVDFLQCAPPEAYRGTCIEYIVDSLLVHLDDPAGEIQSAVFEVLRSACAVSAPIVGRKASAERGRHRSPVFIDELLKIASGDSVEKS